MNTKLNWQSLAGIIVMLLPAIQAITGYDAAPLWHQIEIGAGAGLTLWGRFKDSSFSFTSSTFAACVLAFASTFLTQNGVDVENEVAPQANTLFQAAMAIAAMLGIKLNINATALEKK